MGCWYLVECTNCDYKVESSAGIDEGFFGKVQTHVCIGCNNLVDVTIEPNEHMKDNPNIDKCKKCKSDKIILWDTEERLCPKCGFQMTVSENPTTLWD